MPKLAPDEPGGNLVRFHGQWVIGDESAKRSPEFREIPLSSALLFVHPTLRAIPVLAGGDRIGWLLGTPISLSQHSFIEGELEAAPCLGQLEDWIESEIYALGGSWIFILDHRGETRVYLDCAGSLSAVFDPARKRIGATAETLLSNHEYETRLIKRRISELEVPSDGWISGHLTAHAGLYRLLANHYLDLKTFEAVRHWPLRSPSADLPIDVGATRVARAATAAIAATAEAPNSFMGLTGGYDTRMLLSMARPVRDELQFMTIAAPDSERDVHLARRLAREFELQHRIIPLNEANEAQRAAWDRRVGHVVTGVNRRMHPALWLLGDCYFIGGQGGGVGRGFLWMGAHEQTEIDATSILDRLKLPRRAYLLEAVHKWLTALPSDLNTLEVLDLVYIELRLSSWAFGPAYSNPTSIKINPLNSRAAYSGMLSISTNARRDDLLRTEIIKQNWPELLDVPLNRYGDLRDLSENARRAFRLPGKAARKVRQVVRVGFRKK